MPHLSQFKSSPPPLVAGRLLSFLDFQVVSLIGAGSSGSVYHVVDKVTSRDLAMKIIPTGSENAELALREYSALREVAGALFTITLRGFFSDDSNYYLLTDYFPSGDVYAQVDRTGKMSSSQVRYFIAELLIALEHIHSKWLIHRDVNPTNVLVDEEGHIALADFGISRAFGDQQATGSGARHTPGIFVTSKECGTPAYNSPEVAQGKPYSFEADLWAVGVVMYQMLTHRLPFGLAECEAAGWEMGDAIRFVPLAIESSDKIDKIAFDFMDRVLKKDVNERMSLEEMKNHIYFAGINFDTLSKRKSGRPFPGKVRGSRGVHLSPTPTPINHSNGLRNSKTYFLDAALKPRRPLFSKRLGVWLGRLVGHMNKAKFALPTATPATISPSTVSEASINGGNIHRRSRKPYFFEPLDWGDSSSPTATPSRQKTLYPEPRLPSIVREEILGRRKSVGVRRRVSAIVDDDRADETPPTGFGGLRAARLGPTALDLASIVLSLGSLVAGVR
ncbi:kinase-like domain-containing protein [Thelephora terrestris]|uniref:non-specific serine/threonine protein kinase n=1 Tax=Thelephora terrestris TaxID=56493 RepID=A0A9P6H9K0_9AGAM|nr:kinase-like domain-containing protein [Thelephora terrestris]